MAAIQGIVGIVSLLLGLIGIGLFGDMVASQLNPPRFEVNSTLFERGMEAEPPSSITGPGKGICRPGSPVYCTKAAVQAYSELRIAREGVISIRPLVTPGLLGSVALAYAGLIGVTAAAGKAGPEVMAAAFGTALVFNLVAFGFACQIAAATNYGPSTAELDEDPTFALWKTYYSNPCYSTDWEALSMTTANERCAPAPYVEAILAFAIINCLVNVVAVLYSVCAQDKTQ